MNLMIIGLIAGFLTTTATLPQILKVLKSKETKDISLIMYTMLSLGIATWLIYGFLINDIPLVAWNIIGFILSSTVIALKIKYG